MYRETRIGTRKCLLASGKAAMRGEDPLRAGVAVLDGFGWMDDRDKADIRRTLAGILRPLRVMKNKLVPGYLAFSGTEPVMQAFNRAWKRRWVRTRKLMVRSQLKMQGDRAIPVVFYLVSSHQHPQPAHAELQGKLLVDRFWKSKLAAAGFDTTSVAKYIRNRKIHTVQWAMGEPCYLLTRPNCRHYLIPVATKYALSHSLGDIRKLVQPRKTGVHRPLSDHDRWVAFVDLRAAVLSDLRNELMRMSGWKAEIGGHRAK